MMENDISYILRRYKMKKNNLLVGNFCARPGERVSGVQEIVVKDQKYTLPLFLINGKGAGPTLIVTGGVHAAEYASIAAALELGQNLNPARLHGQVIVAPLINTPGFKTRSVYVNPLDNINLNRVFPGNTQGGLSEQVAAWVTENIFKKGDFYVDLHGGDLVEALMPFSIIHRSGNPEVDQKSLEMAKVFGIPYIVVSESRGSAFSSAARGGIPAMLSEAGGQGIWPRTEVLRHVNGLRRLMQHYGMLKGAKPRELKTTVLEKFIWLRSEHDGYYYPDTAINRHVKKGQILGKITDFEGKLLQQVAAPEDGVVLFLVTCLAINKTDPLMAIGA
jgi:uncharacterized protein